MVRRAGIALRLFAISLFAAAAIAGCGGSSADDASAGKEGDQTLPLKSQPEIEVPAGLPPKKLVIKDLQKGTGEEAQKGDKVKIQYYGIDWREREHANSWNYSGVPAFTLGEHRLLLGLTRALIGMREGGGREVIIPSDLVYYPGEQQTKLGPLDALIYKVYLVDVAD
jgi:peptidylprolyl isomerase